MTGSEALSVPILKTGDRLVGLVVKVAASKAADLEFDSRLHHGDFSRSSHTSDFKLGTSMAALPGAWRYRVSAGLLSVYCDWVR